MCVLALGFEQMVPGALKGAWTDRPSPLGRFIERLTGDQGWMRRRRARRSSSAVRRVTTSPARHRPSTFARISVKARQHAARNPLAVFRQTVTLDEVLASPSVFDPLTRLQCCPPTCGAAAAIVCSADFARRTGWTCACASPPRP
jgi:acetyl-CoA acetyltransferase